MPADQTTTAKLWGGRFSGSTAELVESFTESVSFDRLLWKHDIEGSIAHARMLAEVGVLSGADRDAIVEGLEAIAADIEAGRFSWSERLEDVHMNIEAALTERIGEPGKKLHTGRSRNDQVATDVRLYLREQIDVIDELLSRLQRAVVEIAHREARTLMPGFTHLQAAQPVTFGHHMMAWYEMLVRDRGRLVDARKRTNLMPLGAAALAGTSFPVDREMTARLLRFEGLCENSLDAVSDRDFIIEFCNAAATLMMHLSRMSEELILWSSPQFDFVELADAYCTGSSIMPQKKNPDVAELVRGKSARVIGHANALLVLMKGQPLAFNRDNQEDKEALFDTVHTVKSCLEVFAGMLPGMRAKRENMRAAASRGYATATDLADYLVRRGVSFREAHEIVGKTVARGIRTGRSLEQMALAELREFSSAIAEDVFEVLTLEGSVHARSHSGGTAPDRVLEAAERARARLDAENPGQGER